MLKPFNSEVREENKIDKLEIIFNIEGKNRHKLNWHNILIVREDKCPFYEYESEDLFHFILYWSGYSEIIEQSGLLMQPYVKSK